MKIFGFFNSKNTSLNKFRSITANAVIGLILIGLFFLTYTSDALNAFSGNPNLNAIYSGNPSSNNISLMINVYWGNECLDGILNVLKENEIKTTFFVGGTWAERFPELLQKIYDDEHEIANHGYYHKDHSSLSYQRNLEEISNTHELIKRQLGVEMQLFAPPSGAFNSTTLEIAESLGYKTIMWTRDTIDWRDQNTELIYQRALKNAGSGDLILMHPTAKTLEALPQIISDLKKLNLNIVKVSETIK